MFHFIVNPLIPMILYLVQIFIYIRVTAGRDHED